MRVINSPQPLVLDWFETVVFLAGSIENGTAKEWHQEVIDACSNFDVTFVNPRRTTWDANDEQVLRKQIQWELSALDACHVAFFYFQGDTLSPISLLELGKMSETGMDLIVVCEDDFWRKVNIEETILHQCDGRVSVHSTLQEGINDLRSLLTDAFA